MAEFKLRTKAEYMATIQSLRDEAKRLESAPVSNLKDANEQGKAIKALRERADVMERAAYTDGTVKLEWQQAEVQRQQERDQARFKTAQAVDKRVNPARYIDQNLVKDYLNNSVDLFSGLDHYAKVDLIASLMSGEKSGTDIDGNAYIQAGNSRATLHNDSYGQYVSFVGADKGGRA